MSTIRLSKTKIVENSLKLLRSKRYPALADTEILKLLISKEVVEILSEEKKKPSFISKKIIKPKRRI